MPNPATATTGPPELQAQTLTAPVVPLLLSQPAAIKYVGLSRATFFRLRSAGRLPAPVDIEGAGVTYRRSDLEKFVERLRHVRGGRVGKT